MKVLAALALIAASLPALAQHAVLTGPARAIDGDTLAVGAVKVRLEGIDAPEQDQTCTSAAGEAWPCGRSATNVLAGLVDGRDVSCQITGYDKYRRELGVCWTAEFAGTLNAHMVRVGLAVAFVRYSNQYVPEETEAQTGKLGMWAGAFMRPDEFRAARRAR